MSENEYSAVLEKCLTLAHELFHAYQHYYQENNDDERALMYGMNSVTITKGTDGKYDEYKNQLIEREAFYFGEDIAKRIKEIYKKINPSMETSQKNTING